MEKDPKYVRTSAEILAEQKARHEKPPREVAAAPAAATAVTPRGGDALAEYIEQLGDGLPGKLIKFDPKQAAFVGVEDGEALTEGSEWAALCDQLMVGWIRFSDDGAPPAKVMGLPVEGFRLPPPESLPDNDEANWQPGLDGRPVSPWKHQQLLPLQNTRTHEVIVFSTLTETGRRSVGRLLAHYRRMLRSAPDELPVIRLIAGGFRHRDERIGWVPTPEFRIVGRVKRDGSPAASLPDLDDDMSDQVPF